MTFRVHDIIYISLFIIVEKEINTKKKKSVEEKFSFLVQDQTA